MCWVREVSNTVLSLCWGPRSWRRVGECRHAHHGRLQSTFTLEVLRGQLWIAMSMEICLFSEVKKLSACNKATAKRDHVSGPSPRFSVSIPRCQKRHRNPDMKTANSTGKQLAAPASPLASELKPHSEGSEEIMQSFMHFQMWDLAEVLRCSYPRIYYIGY